jgi:hypothetical protein
MPLIPILIRIQHTMLSRSIQDPVTLFPYVENISKFSSSDQAEILIHIFTPRYTNQIEDGQVTLMHLAIEKICFEGGISSEVKKEVLESMKILCRFQFSDLLFDTIILPLFSDGLSQSLGCEAVFRLLMSIASLLSESQLIVALGKIELFVLATSKISEIDLTETGVVSRLQPDLESLLALDCLQVILGASIDSIGGKGFDDILRLLVKFASMRDILSGIRLRSLDILLSFRASSQLRVSFARHPDFPAKIYPSRVLVSSDTLECPGALVFPVSEYMDMVVDSLASETSWAVFWHLVRHLPIQLENVYIFQNASESILRLVSLIFQMVNSESVAASVVDIPTGFRTTEIFDAVFKLAMPLLVYSQFYNKQYQGEISQSFMQGMQKWPRGNTAKICIQVSRDNLTLHRL